MGIKLRLIQKEDYPLTLAWRSNKAVYDGRYQQFQNQKPLTWEEHIKWNESRNADWRSFIAIYEGRPVGVVTISQLDHWCPEIGLYLGEISLWGKGIGTEMLRRGIMWIQEYSLSQKYIVGCHTTILDSNSRAIRVFKKCGFKRIAVAREGESWYQRMLGKK